MTRTLASLLGLLISAIAYAMPIDLSTNTSLYIWDRPGDQAVDQHLYLSLRPGASTHLKIGARYDLLLDPGDQNLRLDEAALQWSASPNLLLQFGRSHPTIGASTGLLDGAEARLRPTSKLAVTFFGGIAAKYYRWGGETYGDHWRVGSGVSYRSLPHARADVYMTHEQYRGRVFRQQFGWSFYGKPAPKLSISTFGRADLKHQELAYTTLSADYELVRDLRLSAEYLHSEPRIPNEDLDIRPPKYQELSGGFDWRISRSLRVRTHLGFITTLDEKGDSERVYVTLGRRGTYLTGNLYRYKLGETERQIWTLRLRRSFRIGLALSTQYRQFQYQYAPGARAYRSQTVEVGLDYQLLNAWIISLQAERSWRDNGRNDDNRLFANLGYRFRGE